ncbi:family 17 glycosyltransferase [Colletotrichum falcatum]|nr:family 17 glycosyltransferase [Colletotrichum falcatum]
MKQAIARHQIKYLTIAAILVFIWMIWRFDLHQEVLEHGKQLTYPHSGMFPAFHKTENEVLSPEDALEYCDHFRLQPASHELVRSRKVFDLLLINTEVEMLEVRLGQMAPYVDYFVIIESDKTFTDLPKPLYVKENWDLFRPWHDKMILRTMDLNALKEGSAWDREASSRNSMFTQVIPTLTGVQAAAFDDVILVSDVDEIPKPSAVRALRNCAIPPRVTIHSEFYYYSYQWLSKEDWVHPQATIYQGENTVLPHDLRHNANDHHIYHGSWHCSYCFSTVDEMAQKITSFSHSELNKPEFKDPDWIANVSRHGHDIVGVTYDRIQDNQDIPNYIKENRKKFDFLVDRDPPNANFRDYIPQ